MSKPLMLAGCWISALAVLTTVAQESDAPPKVLNDLPLLFHDDFDADVEGRWERTDKNAWKYATVDGKTVAHLHKNSDYSAEVRSPNSIAWINDLVVGDFVLQARLKSLGRPNDGHRDLCLFWGGTDPSHFYYVHMGKEADPHSNSIFLVNGSPRVSIAKTRTDGTPWDDAYHTVWVVRDVESGKIEVFFDDRSTPAMTAVDKTFTAGRLGIGSFDNTGYFDSVTVWGKTAKLGKPAVAVVNETHPRVLLSTSKGQILLELDAEKAPVTVANFLQYVDDGHFNGMIFHRVIPNFMVQGGGFDTAMNEKPTREGIKNEWQNGLKNERGTVSMARRGGLPESATAQFFINVSHNAFLDRAQPDGAGYAVFGKVVEGIDVVDTIVAVPTHTIRRPVEAQGRTVMVPHQNVPTEPITIDSAKRVPAEK